jgi:hypothetical protein
MAKGSNSGNSGGYSSFGDMFDGGGPGQSGSTFGGAFGGVSNAVGATPSGSGIAPSGLAGGIMGGYTGLGDMFDGGGPGQRGDTFGGFFGGQSNAAGATPYGSGVAPSGIAGGFMGNGSAAVSPAAMAMSMAGGPDEVRANLMEMDIRKLIPATAQTATVSLTGDEASRRNAERSRVPTYEEGGMVGPGGKPIRPSTRKAELPPILQNLMAVPSYAEGGMVGPGGMPMRPSTAASTSPVAINAMQGGAPIVGLAQPGAAGSPLNFAAIDMEAQRFMQQNPQQVEQIKAEVQRAMAEGELDAAALNMFVQVATVALQNPDMWPQLRQSLIAQDMLDPEDIGEEYDQGFLITLYIIGKTMGGGQMTTPAPMSAGQEPQMSMREGGPLPAKSENPDGSIPINAHEGEYVIPADVARKLGTDHFDKLIAKARGVDAKGEQQ